MQFTPAAIDHAKRLRGLRRVAHAREPHFAVFHAPEVGVEQRKFACVIARGARPRTVPHETHDPRHHAGGFARRHRQRRVEIRSRIESLRIRLCAGGGRDGEFEHAAAGVALARNLRLIKRARGLEVEFVELSAHPERCCLRAGDRDIEPEAVESLRVLERQPVDEPLRALAEGFGVAYEHLPRALRRNRIHAQLEIVALRDLQQARIDLAARDVLEHGLTARFVDRHRLAHASVHIQREAEHVLPVEQRELQFAFEHAPVRIKERQRNLGDGKIAADLGAHGHLLHAHRRINRRGDHELRPRQALDAGRRKVLGDCRGRTARACNQEKKSCDTLHPRTKRSHCLLPVIDHCGL